MKILSRLTLALALLAAPALLLGCGEEAAKPVETPASTPAPATPATPTAPTAPATPATPAK